MNNLSNDIKLSFIIPSYNSADTIGDVIKAIKKSFSNQLDKYEIILVDNMSNDKSRDIALSFGSKVIRSEARTVSGVRNDGAKVAKGEILAFIDADVEIDPSWCAAFDLVDMRTDTRLITGSHCTVPDHIVQPFFTWYKSIENDDRDTHLGSGHMIIPRRIFDELGGFDDFLMSGEDYDLCSRARKHGIRVHANNQLKAKHLGYPNTVLDFVSRERWHGESDFRSFLAFFKSKIAISSVIFIFIHVAVILTLWSGEFVYIMGSFIFILIFLSSFVCCKFGWQDGKSFINNILVSYLYFWGRAGSIIYIVSRRWRNE